MKCSALMTLDLRWVRDNATARDAALVMRDSSVGFLPVIDAAGGLAGVLTDRDLAVRLATTDRLPSDVAVRDVMTRDPFVCRPEDGIATAEALMAREGKSRLVVVDERRRPVGIISLTDVLARDRRGRALRTARRVLARESDGPHPPLEGIRLTPEALPTRATGSTPTQERSLTATSGDAVIVGGATRRSIREFP